METFIDHRAQLAAIVIAQVFLWSGAVKLRRPRAAAQALVDFGLRRSVELRAATALGAIELALGMWILSEQWISAALVLATAVLLLFAALIAFALLRGKSFACACFGESSGAISVWTVLRTLFLAGCAAFATVAIQEGPGVGRLTLDDLALWEIGAGALSCAVLVSLVPRLLIWNRDPYSIGTAR